MDIIKIEKLEVYGYHGFFDFEKQKGQFFYVDAELEADTQRAGIKDSLELTVNYAGVCDYIESFMKNNTLNLIEAVAEKMAVGILNKFEPVKAVTLTIHKPQAPVNQKVSDLMVTIKRQRHRAYIAYGSNEGNSREIIKGALEKFGQDDYITLMADSGLYKSTPYGGVDQQDFYNGVVEIETYLEPYNLLERLNEIEADFGRTRLVHWGPRTLDLDIIFYDSLVMDDEKLTIPHADMVNRDFVLVPLAKLAPAKRHPVLNRTVSELKDALEEEHII